MPGGHGEGLPWSRLPDFSTNIYGMDIAEVMIGQELPTNSSPSADCRYWIMASTAICFRPFA